MAKTIMQDANYPIELNTLKSGHSGILYITIHQDGKTIFLEHSKLVEFLKTVNTFK